MSARSLVDFVSSSGWEGHLGWSSLGLLLVFALVVVIDGFKRRSSKYAAAFFACAHVQALVFFLCNGVLELHSLCFGCGVGIEGFMFGLGLTLLALSTGSVLIIASIMGVAFVTRERPVMRFWSWAGLFAFSVTIGLFVASLLILATAR